MKRALNFLLMLCIFATATAQSTFTSALKAKPAKGANLYGTVECNGTPLAGVAVSDGYQIVLTSTPLPFRVSTSSQTEMICKARAFALVRNSESFIIVLLFGVW